MDGVLPSSLCITTRWKAHEGWDLSPTPVCRCSATEQIWKVSLGAGSQGSTIAGCGNFKRWLWWRGGTLNGEGRTPASTLFFPLEVSDFALPVPHLRCPIYHRSKATRPTDDGLDPFKLWAKTPSLYESQPFCYDEIKVTNVHSHST